MKDNPLPAVHGRICYHPCEEVCNRLDVDPTASIHAVERFLGDRALEEGWPAPGWETEFSGKRVLIVGAGPSGLSAAFHLRRMGHDVVIHEAGPLAGGMMLFGIPKYRLPREILDAEIERIRGMDIDIVLNHKVEDLVQEMADGNFDAAFLGIGAHVSRRVDIPARDAGRIYDAIGHLPQVETRELPQIGRRVAIYGRGNAAMDAARTATRLGGEEALIIYRRTREHIPTHDFEAEKGMEEGIKIHWLRMISETEETEFKVEVMELDESGHPQPTGRYESLEADSLIMALGQDIDKSFLRQIPDVMFKTDGTIEVDENMMTGHAGLFAGGDMVPSGRTVSVAMGHGQKAALSIDGFLHHTDTAW